MVPELSASILPDSAACQTGRLTLGGCDLGELAAQYGTPLYIYDRPTLWGQAQRARRAFAPLRARVSFAAKACSTPGVLRIFRDAGLALDAVSAGELEAARRADFEPAAIHLHGNAKSAAELKLAVHLGLHAVVVDNRDELERLEEVCRTTGQRTSVMVRIAPSLEPDTHPHLQTAGKRSKFGVSGASEEGEAIFRHLQASPVLHLIGLHAHVGSQIKDVSVYAQVAQELVTLAKALRRFDLAPTEISLGGGWAVAYRDGDPEVTPDQVAASIGPAFAGTGLRPAVEPGRWLTARAGLALYQVEAVKRVDGRRLVAVDGGMGDNPRPALYGARYTALLPDRVDAPPTGPADVVGRYCEAGDVLVQAVALPEVKRGDLVGVPVSGAYQISMASSYNLVPPPAVVLVEAGRSHLLTRRPTAADLLAWEILPHQAERRGPEVFRGGGVR
jgi:diaminopimelate decarboxylase